MAAFINFCFDSDTTDRIASLQRTLAESGISDYAAWLGYGDERDGKHHWRRIVSDPASFEAQLLEKLNISKDDFATYINAMKTYRDRFIAHLDSDEDMKIPHLDQAKRSVEFYHMHLVSTEGLTGDLAAYYEVFSADAMHIFASLQAKNDRGR